MSHSEPRENALVLDRQLNGARVEVEQLMGERDNALVF